MTQIKKNAKNSFDQNRLNKIISIFNPIEIILFGLFIGSIALTIWEINIYQKTFVPLSVPLTMWVLPGLLTTPFLKRVLTVHLKASVFLQLFYNIVTWGGLVTFAFMWTNYNFPSKAKIEINEKIISVGHFAKGGKGRCGQPYIVINYKGQDKQLVYYCGVAVEHFKSVDLTISKGLFGFEIITKSELKTD